MNLHSNSKLPETLIWDDDMIYSSIQGGNQAGPESGIWAGAAKPQERMRDFSLRMGWLGSLITDPWSSHCDVRGHTKCHNNTIMQTPRLPKCCEKRTWLTNKYFSATFFKIMKLGVKGEMVKRSMKFLGHMWLASFDPGTNEGMSWQTIYTTCMSIKKVTCLWSQKGASYLLCALKK